MRKQYINLAAVAAAVVFAANPVFAASNINGGATTDTSAVFEKYLVMDYNANVPTYTSTFTISPGSAVTLDSPTSGQLSVLAGVGSPTITSAEFSSSDTTVNGLPVSSRSPDRELEDVDETTIEELPTHKKYVSKDITVDFSGVTFSEPGVYRYIITEEASTNPSIVNDSVATRTLDVYVESGDDGTCAIAGYVMYSGTVTGAAVSADTATGKSNDFTNSMSSQDISIGKEVTGNQGSKDKYFKFTVALSGLTANQQLNISLDTADATVASNDATVTSYVGQTNPTTATADENGSVSIDYYLADGDYITIKGVPKGASYTITESNEDYTSTDGITEAVNGMTAFEDATSGTIEDADIMTGFTNSREGTIPTGVATAMAGGLIAAAVGIGGFIATRKKKDEDDE